MTITDPETRAKQIACPHRGAAIRESVTNYVRCADCGLTVVNGKCRWERTPLGLCRVGFDHGAAELHHDWEDMQVALYAFLLKEHGYDPLIGNAPGGLIAIKHEFERNWPGPARARW